jgi:aspartyl-tRNA(Asn)/glutamyl-tRNA(Gln) amidotransferase subunit B
MSYQSFIGLEIHIHLKTKSKVFCDCEAGFGDAENSRVCPVCMGYPGVMPRLNGEAILMGYTVARALGCALSPRTVFERKHYFYPDMPKNYQISQFAHPLGEGGRFEFELAGERRSVSIRECHLEEDAGKMIHAGDMSLLDNNRAGYPLLEIVTNPDMSTGEEAEAFLLAFRRMVRYLGVCDGNMEEGSLRCDANVSVNAAGKGLGVKVELKNMNSSRFVKKGLNYEIARQIGLLESGKAVVQETRLWNENRDQTETMRRKESAHDYRYFPEPDLPPFSPDAAFLARVEAAQVELPLARKARLMAEGGISAELADFIVEEKAMADYYEAVIATGVNPATAAAWLSSDVQGQLKRAGIGIAEAPLDPARFARVLKLLESGAIHSKIAKQTIQAVFDEGKDPEAIIAERGWDRAADSGELGAILDELLAREASTVERIKGGDKKPLAYLIGEAMKASEGRAEPRAVKDAIMERIGAV